VKAIRNTERKSLQVGHPATPDPTTMSEEQLAERRKTVERLKTLTKRVEEGEEGAMPALRELLDENPDLRLASGRLH
jgi:hypothetical protein